MPFGLDAGYAQNLIEKEGPESEEAKAAELEKGEGLCCSVDRHKEEEEPHERSSRDIDGAALGR